MGRCIASADQQSKESIARKIRKLRWQNPPTADSYWEDMNLIRRRGWAVDKDHNIGGLPTVAGLVGSRKQAIRVCITFIGFPGPPEHSTHRTGDCRGERCLSRGLAGGGV